MHVHYSIFESHCLLIVQQTHRVHIYIHKCIYTALLQSFNEYTIVVHVCIVYIILVIQHSHFSNLTKKLDK